MIMHIFGTINKRIDVGYDKSTDTIFIKASSNCISFTTEEMDCLMAVLTIANNFPVDTAFEFLSNRMPIALWEPAPPAAEIRIL